MAKARGLNTWLNRATKRLLVQTSSGDMERSFAPLVFHDESGEPASNAEWIHAPDLSAVAAFPAKYWIVTGDAVALMDAAQRDAVDAAERDARRDAAVQQLDQLEDVLRAFMLSVLDELNNHAAKVNEILDAIDSGANLAAVKTNIAAIADFPQRTVDQLKTVIRSKLGS
jgi:hypothetical protein